MATKESEGSSIDYEFLKKYIRDDSPEEKQDNNSDFSKKFTIEKQTSVEVFGSVGEGESFSKNPFVHKKREFEESDLSFESPEKIESKSNITDAKKEFIEHLEDDSLSLDTCSNLTNDWNKK
jgi:hypothetical protein